MKISKKKEKTPTVDTMEILLKKADAIKIANQEALGQILSRKGQHIISHHRFNLEHSIQTNDSNSLDDQLVTLIDNNPNKYVNKILESWRYRGKALTTERIAFETFIDIKIKNFDDLIRLHVSYERLLEKYFRLLRDETESRAAVEVVLYNMELLKVAIGEVQVQTTDIFNAAQMGDAMNSFTKNLSTELKSLQTKVPGLYVDLQAHISKPVKEAYMMQFHNCEKLECRYTLTGHKGVIWAMEPYIFRGKQYLATASSDKTIKIWNLWNNTVAETLTGHTDEIYALALYVQNGVQMIASGGRDRTIRLWDLSHYNQVHTFSNKESGIMSLATFEKGGKAVLVSGDGLGTIMVRDLINYQVLATWEGYQRCVDVFCIYYLDDIPHLASGSRDGTLGIWSLEDYTSITIINKGIDQIRCLVVVGHGKKKILASGDKRGCVTLWGLEHYKRIATIKARALPIRTLQVMRDGGRVCFASPGEARDIKLWDLKSNKVIATLNCDSIPYRINVFMNGDRSCMASGHDNGSIKLWMENE